MVCPCTGTAATAWRTAEPLHGHPAPAGQRSGTGRDRHVSSSFTRQKKAGAYTRQPQIGELGGAIPPVLSESRHLGFGRLAVERSAGVLNRPVEGLPCLADNLFVGRHRTLGCHA